MIAVFIVENKPSYMIELILSLIGLFFPTLIYLSR